MPLGVLERKHSRERRLGIESLARLESERKLAGRDVERLRRKIVDRAP